MNSNRDAAGRWASATVSASADAAPRGPAASISAATDPGPVTKLMSSVHATGGDPSQIDVQGTSGLLSTSKPRTGGGMKMGSPGGISIQPRPEMDLTPMGGSIGGGGGGGDIDDLADKVADRLNPTPPENDPGRDAALRAGGFGGPEGPGMHQVSAIGGRAGHGADIPGGGVPGPGGTGADL